MTWSSKNIRWEKTVTANILGPKKYKTTAVEDRNYNLTAVNQEKITKITWDRIDIAETVVHTNKFGVTRIIIFIEFEHSKNHVDGATVFVNGNQCKEIEQKIYMYRVKDWGPIQNYFVEANAPNFDQTMKTVSILHTSNTSLYILIGLITGLTTTVFVLKRKKRIRSR
jgi:hypothetical protein